MSDSSDISSLFQHHQVAPDVVPQPPPKKLTLVYDDGSTVEGGNELLIANTQKEPTVSFPTQAGQYYSLLMVDPDNYSREKPTFRQFIHWFVVNIAGVAGGQGVNVPSGFVVSPYMGCAPDPGSGRHRYVFLLYQQQAHIPTDHIKVLGQPKLLGLVANLDERKNHDIAKWFSENAGGQQPTLLAGNFFHAEMTK